MRRLAVAPALGIQHTCYWTMKPKELAVTKRFKVIVERHPEGYTAYPLGLNGVVVGEGDTYEEALCDVTSAIRFHIDAFGPEALAADSSVLDAFIAEASVAV